MPETSPHMMQNVVLGDGKHPQPLEAENILPARAGRFWDSQFGFLSGRAPRTSAFTLVEMIGVAAIAAILAMLAAPAVLRQIDEAARTREISDLNAISNAIVLQVLGTKTIPNAAGLPPSVASWIRQPAGKINKNRRGYDRIFLIDGSGWFQGGRLPYTQNNSGTTNPPLNARLIIVSSLGGPALPVTSGLAASSAEFDAIWSTIDRGKPSTWATTWAAGKGDDLVIQRMNLEPLFHRLVLINRDSIIEGKYSIQPATTSTNLPPRTTRTAYFLDGTDVTLMQRDGVPQERVQLKRDESYAFSGSQWGGDYFGPGSEEDTAEGLAYWAFRFMKAGQSPWVQQGATPEGTVSAMYNFMLVFSLWANKCFDGIHFPQYGSGPESTTVPEYVLLSDIAGGGNQNDKIYLNDFSGVGGLLNPPPNK